MDKFRVKYTVEGNARVHTLQVNAYRDHEAYKQIIDHLQSKKQTIGHIVQMKHLPAYPIGQCFVLLKPVRSLSTGDVEQSPGYKVYRDFYNYRGEDGRIWPLWAVEDDKDWFCPMGCSASFIKHTYKHIMDKFIIKYRTGYSSKKCVREVEAYTDQQAYEILVRILAKRNATLRDIIEIQHLPAYPIGQCFRLIKPINSLTGHGFEKPVGYKVYREKYHYRGEDGREWSLSAVENSPEWFFPVKKQVYEQYV